MIDTLLQFPSNHNTKVAQHEQINKLITSIYDVYIKEGEQQINLSAANRKYLMSREHRFMNYTLAEIIDDRKGLFVRCTLKVELLITGSTLSGFFKSSEFQSIARARNKYSN